MDDIALTTGSRDNGTAYAFLNFFRKLGQVLSAVAVNGALLAMGYYSTASSGSFVFSQTQLGTMFTMATLIPAVLFAAMALVLALWYPLSRTRVQQLQVEKEAALRREAQA